MARKGNPIRHYTVYLRKTDEIIACGTANECAIQLGLTGKNSFYSSVHKTRKGIHNKYEFVVENTAYDEEAE